MNSLPILIITAGATGSGKSKLIKETFKDILGYISKYKTFLVDALVENDDKYKEYINEIFEVYECEPPFESEACDAINPTNALMTEFKTAYFKVRNQPGCINNDENLNCNQLNDRNIKKALDKNQNIVIETTGTYIPTWVLNLNISNYCVVFAYSVVLFEVLLERNAKRAYRSFTAYYNNRSLPAPRLIDIREATF